MRASELAKLARLPTDAIADFVEKTMALMHAARALSTPPRPSRRICPEIRGDYEAAIACYEKVIDHRCAADWQRNAGRSHRRPAAKTSHGLREKLASR